MWVSIASGNGSCGFNHSFSISVPINEGGQLVWCMDMYLYRVPLSLEHSSTTEFVVGPQSL